MLKMVFREVTYMSVVVRLFFSIVIGGILGLERGMKNRPAGFRTYMLVCNGACLIMLTNQYIYQMTGTGDPMRLGAQVVSGIGFLGAGTIVVTKHNQIKGLTTAAGLWTAAGVGLALGIGFYEAAVTAAVGVFLILTLLHQWEHLLHKKIRNIEVYVELQNTVPLGEFIGSVRSNEFDIEGIYFEEDGILRNDSKAFVISLRTKTRQEHLTIKNKLKSIPGVVHIEEL